MLLRDTTEWNTNGTNKVSYLLYGTHSYWTSRYLYVPGQGSGNTSGPATTAHWVRLLHLQMGWRERNISGTHATNAWIHCSQTAARTGTVAQLETQCSAIYVDTKPGAFTPSPSAFKDPSGWYGSRQHALKPAVEITQMESLSSLVWESGSRWPLKRCCARMRPLRRAQRADGFKSILPLDYR